MKYLYCHPIFDERKRAHRFSYHLQKAFEEKEKRITRFDYYGTGESEGDFEDVTVITLRDDILKHLKEGPCCLIGTRFGATLALDCMLQMPEKIKMLFLINPILHGADYINYLRRKQRIKDILTGNKEQVLEEYYVNIEGFKTNPILINQIESELLLDFNSINGHLTPIHYFNISKNEIMSSESKKRFEDLKKVCPNMVVHQLDMPLFWRRIPEYDYSDIIKLIVDYCNAN